MKFDTNPQTISWINDRYREGNLEIKPPYQRKPIWVLKQKCYLIESILQGYPIPEIYVQQITTAEGATSYAIVDGQQRTRSILQFIGSDQDESEAEFVKFSLDMLDTNSPWYGKKLADLDEVTRKKFYGYRLAVRLLDTDSDVEVREMFDRLNRFLSPLKPQELRNATYTGPFAKLSTSLADDEYWAENGIVQPALIRRMRDVEFVSELLIGVLHGPQGGASSVIEEYYQQYEDYEEFPGQAKAKKLFKEILDLVREVLPDIKETRWSNRTDFYTLFVGLAQWIKEKGRLSNSQKARLRTILDTFESAIDLQFELKSPKANPPIAKYVQAAEKGANDKKRRADRQESLWEVMEQMFASNKKR